MKLYQNIFSDSDFFSGPITLDSKAFYFLLVDLRFHCVVF